MSQKKTLYLKALIFIFLFLAMIGIFFVYKEQFKDGVLRKFYGKKSMHIMSIIFLLIGWMFWEFASGKRKSNLFSTMSILFLVLSLSLGGNLLTFIGVGITIFLILPFMILEFKNDDFKYIANLKNIITKK